MRVIKIRGEHPDDQIKFVLSCIDAVGKKQSFPQTVTLAYI